MHNDTKALRAAATAHGLAEPLLDGHEVRVFERAVDGREALLAIIEQARERIELDAALLHTPGVTADLLGALLERCAQGVHLRVFSPPLQFGLLTVKLALLRNAGATVTTQPPPRGSLQRQLLLVDGRAAWWGPGLPTNEPDERAPHVCIEGPIVQHLRPLLVQTLPARRTGRRSSDQDVVPAGVPSGGMRVGLAHCTWRAGAGPGPGPGGVLVDAVNTARWRVFIGLGQLPPQALVDALASASRRGVAVSLLLQHDHQHDWRWRQCCSELLLARVWIYHSSRRLAFAPHCTVDGVWSCLAQDGGAQWPSLVVLGEAFAEALDAACQTTVEQASLLDAQTVADDRLMHQLIRAAWDVGALFGGRVD